MIVEDEIPEGYIEALIELMKKLPLLPEEAFVDDCPEPFI